MPERPRRKIKVAIAGTSSSGKTTLVHAAAAALKASGVLVDTVTSSDRRVPFPIETLDNSIDGHAWVVANHMALELDRLTRPDCDVILTDRSVVDLWAVAYARTLERHPEQQHQALFAAIDALVIHYVFTYNAILYAPPLPYTADTLRLPDTDRLAMEPVIRSHVLAYRSAMLLPPDPDDRLGAVLNVVRDLLAA